MRKVKSFLQNLNRYQVAFLSYIILAALLALTVGEVRPFFNGTWFSRVPHHVEDYGFLVTEVDGEALNPPRYLESLSKGPLRFWRFDAYVMTQKIGKNFEFKSVKAFDNSLNYLQSAVIRKTQIKMILQKRNFDLIDFIENKKISNAEDLRVVEFGK